jgi:hypothetical protein
LATKVIVCPECSQLVAYGRLSCQSCGALLASVEGGEREEPLTVVPGITDPPRLIPDDLPPPPGRAAARGDAGPAAAMRWADEGPHHAGPVDTMSATTRSAGRGKASSGSGFRTPEEVLGAAAGRRPLKPGQASLLADLPFDAPASVGGWLIALGSGLGVAGFLLPWAERMNLALPAGGYFGSWGLAGPGHGFALVAALVTLALAILPTPVPSWVRDRALAPILAGVLFGLAWPYLLGVVQPLVGVLVTSVAAILLAAGVVQLQRPPRPTETERNDRDLPSV